MTVPRAVQIPFVAMPYDSETVVLRTPLPAEQITEYLESTLTPDEARRLGLALMVDAERAKEMVETNKRLRKSAERRQVREAGP